MVYVFRQLYTGILRLFRRVLHFSVSLVPEETRGGKRSLYQGG